MTFEEWMRLALLDPECGYYARNVRTVGPRGDFATASTLHPALGEAVAAWAAERRRDVAGLFSPWHLVEAGPGTGALAEAVLARLRFAARRTLRLHLVETSPVLRHLQRARLAGAARVEWHESLADALAAAGGRAVIYASELLDAFPVRVLRAMRSGWEEMEISLKGDEWREEWRPASWSGDGDGNGGGAEAAAFSALSRPWPEGQRVEVAPAVRSLFHSKKSSPSSSPSFSGSLLPGSCVLFLDYGDEIERLYERRPRGTVRGYAHHVRLEGEDLYRWGGKADVTADVNFTDVAAWAREAGLEPRPLETQGAFLARYVKAAAGRARHDPALAFLLDPGGAGAGFKALELRKR